jgi:hypothetical protein
VDLPGARRPPPGAARTTTALRGLRRRVPGPMARAPGDRGAVV